MRTGIAVLLALSLVVGGCGDTATSTTTAADSSTEVETTTSAAMEDEVEVLVVKDIAYSNDKTLDVHYPADPGPWPVVVMVHGYTVRRSDYRPDMETMAAEGLVVFNVSVDMSYQDWSSEPIGTRLTFPTSIAQEACAIRFARATAADYGGDPNRIVLTGHSAGASTGIVTAMAGDDFDGDCKVAEGSALPNAFVGYEGPYNWSTESGPLKEDKYLVDDGMWEQIDPYQYVGGNPALVVRLVHGDLIDASWDVALKHSEDLHRALAEAGYDAELVVIPDVGHMAFTTAIESVLEVASG